MTTTLLRSGPIGILPVEPSDRTNLQTRRSVVPAGLAAAVLVGGWMIPAGDLAVSTLWLKITAFATAMLLLALPIARRGTAGRLASAFLQSATLVLVIFSGEHALGRLEELGLNFGIASRAASACLNLVGYRSTVDRSILLIDHPDGLVSVAPSMEKLGLRPLLLFGSAWLALLLMKNRAVASSSLVACFVMFVILIIIRYVIILTIYLESDKILTSGPGQEALDWFVSPWITLGFLILAGILFDLLARRPRGASPPSPLPGLKAGLSASAAMLALGALTGLLGHLAPVGAEKGGRVLIDDRFCGIWEPTARRLDTGWYGDFATYSFTSLAEYLGRWYSVDVNTHRAYDDGILSRYDVLILKTPDKPFPESEAKAIERFVQDGGGLLLVGDHTNLLGMGTHLNALSARCGIQFRYDAVSDASGGFVKYERPAIGVPVGALHVKSLEFMTSCSLLLSGEAEPVLAVDNCRRDPHDYAGSSFFGRQGAHPEIAHGRTVLAATARAGRGRVAAFTDSTVWSSFAVFAWDREKLAMDLVHLLNQEPSPFEKPLKILALLSLVVATGLAIGYARSGLVLAALLGGLLGFWSGVALSDALNRSIQDWPQPQAPISEVSFLWQGGACAFPPVLGSLGKLPADQCFDTLLVSTQRLGLVPRVAYTYEEMINENTRSVVAIAPVNRPDPATLRRLVGFVNEGGSLVVMDDRRIGERGSSKDLLGLFGVTLAYHTPGEGESGGGMHVHLGGGAEVVKMPAPDVLVARKSVGKGQVVYVSDAIDFSREGLGHCFARPWTMARARLEVVFALFRDLLRICPGERRLYGILQ